MWSVLFICKNIRGSLRGGKFGQTYKVGDTFTLKELLGKEDIKYRAFTEYSPHGLEMLEKQELCKDYMQGLEPC